MAETTEISWCDRTWSPWEGCTKVSPGCEHCYAAARNGRFAAGANWGPGAPRRRTADWNKPLRWDREAQKAGKRISVFPSLCDPFDNEVDPVWRAEFFDLIASTPSLTWLLLTKRIGNAHDMMLMQTCWDPFKPLANLWLGATMVNQEEVDRDMAKLLRVPARVRFVSLEPLLSAVDLNLARNERCAVTGYPIGHDATCGDCDPCIFGLQRRSGIDWVIVGGESGPKARPMHLDWARSLRDQCAAAGVPFHFKQWGEWIPAGQPYQAAGHAPIREFGYDEAGQHRLHRIGKKAAGRLLDGVEHNGFPEVA